MPVDIDEIKQRIKKVEDAILDVKGRMPAHSAKPHIMMELLDLEDEKAQLENQLQRLTG